MTIITAFWLNRGYLSPLTFARQDLSENPPQMIKIVDVCLAYIVLQMIFPEQ